MTRVSPDVAFLMLTMWSSGGRPRDAAASGELYIPSSARGDAATAAWIVRGPNTFTLGVTVEKPRDDRHEVPAEEAPRRARVRGLRLT